ncbi:Protein MEMO1 [Histomonas meleagridis]|uniref:Protein MEMO1 n=1 Tax=Histomonas meleagridis TaxID=135588 RepID=UPI003559A373|nr:Protein MEMO1 [Histomonas meleagridis]KAH0800870.1 Protein MEMO1 [Histomonas meleagridis]
MQRATHQNSWYPVGRQLISMLDKAFSEASVDPNAKGTTKAIVSPHAGYVYSVSTAAHAFKAVDTSLFNRVVILGPSHYIYINHCTIADAKSIETPLGNIPFDTDTIEKLLSSNGNLFKKLDRATAEKEHSLEMECPLLKYIFKNKQFSIIPIMIGDISPEAIQNVAEALAPIVNQPDTLLVVSSDFCHWGSDFDYTYLLDRNVSINENIERLDKEGMKAISSCDVNAFAKFIKDTGDTICGEVPIKIAMMTIKSKYNVSWPHYSQSSVVRSKYDTSVSYAAGIFRIE